MPNPPSPLSLMDPTRACLCCEVSKTLDQFRALPHGLSTRCTMCLDKLSASHHAKALVTRQKTVQTLPTLNDFYLSLEAARECEAHTHTIPFHSKEASEGNSVHTIRITSFGNIDVLDLDPGSKERSNALKVFAEKIWVQCGKILGYCWRCVSITVSSTH